MSVVGCNPNTPFAYAGQGASLCPAILCTLAHVSNDNLSMETHGLGIACNLERVSEARPPSQASDGESENLKSENLDEMMSTISRFLNLLSGSKQLRQNKLNFF